MKPGYVRIIGGKWRSRRLKVPDIKDLRPTPDRVRETLFNWLSPVIAGAHCLDAFAGSGVLGFEALSRGAASIDMVDQSKEVVELLQEEAILLGAHSISIYRATLPHGLRAPEQAFDIVFLDPPYQNNVLLPCCFYLDKQQYLAKGAYIYLEANREISTEELPPSWQLLKKKVAGQVAYHLFQAGSA